MIEYEQQSNTDEEMSSLVIHGPKSKDIILQIYKEVMRLRKEHQFGQRTITRVIRERFLYNLSENTVSGWIHKNLQPFQNEKTQFKSKSIPLKNELVELYINNSLSASKIALTYKTSTTTVIKWLRFYNVNLRSHAQSMNTSPIARELREKALTKISGNYTEMSPEKAYVLGVLSGDGYLTSKLVKLEIRNDTEFVEEFSSCIEKIYGHKYSYYYYKLKNTYLVVVASELIAHDLLRYGTFRTFTWEVPEEIKTSSNSAVVSSFLRGLFDSDGSICGYSIDLTTASRKGAEGTVDLLNQLGISSKILTPRCYYSIRITHKNNIRKFHELIRFTIRRKTARLTSIHRRGWN